VKKLKKLVLIMMAFLVTFITVGTAYAYTAVDVKTSYYGKKIIFLGDSITASTGIDEADNYANIVANELGFSESEIYGYGGGTWTNEVGTDTSLIDRYTTMDLDADIVVVWAGINDYKHAVPLGTKGNGDDTTFYGAVDFMYSELVTRYPDSKIFVMTPLESKIDGTDTTVANSETLVLSDYVDAMKGSVIPGISIIDLYSLANIDGTDIEDNATFFVDGYHPNATGHQRVADILITLLVELL
jgi:lysophospholipase L1-like esterase